MVKDKEPTYLSPGVANICSKRIQRIIADIRFFKTRENYIMVEDEMSKAIDHLKNAAEKIKL